MCIRDRVRLCLLLSYRMEKFMRGIYSNKTEIRHKVFTEIARMAYEDYPLSHIEDLPFEIIPGEIGKYYDNIFLERAIIGERLRATLGLPVRNMSCLLYTSRCV